ncbi:MotA/TolQ/ExbB proton channel family protein [Reinekea marinisedimentorum]|uniref:Biopolymer transport protein ExbB/TolQ n=1 Tax=Reinekea marinisedimentorum TaxID=230495 RepID=A0A4R3I543_9GAMM|nr:MotA/TolQ/ExbB proton channel family protein [Reinekea marinisedimentorum]TCS40215.1 biopolymer transport protein ExbB/TolQ [Reinekea marinisedimentorum]
MLYIMQSGGSFMWVILAVSVIAFALFAERYYFLFLRLNLNIDKSANQVKKLLQESNYQAALEECNRIIRHPLGRVLKSGILKAGRRDKEIEQALQESVLREVPNLKSRINYLSLVANIATLLGLLGTIIGLISAFAGVADAAASEKQEILSAGISVAMFTTAFGLVVAIPSMAGFYLLNNRSDWLVSKIDEKALSVFSVLTAREQSKD